MKNETPDNYLERNDYVNEPGPPDPDDLCIVCGKLDCICPEDPPQETEQEHMERMVSFAEYKAANKRRCDDCGKPCESDLCQDCCPHDEHDHGICLSCSKDIFDDLVGRAELLRNE